MRLIDHTEFEEKLEEAITASQTAPTCSHCGERMILRENKKESSQFWGCRNFPRCKFTFPYEQVAEDSAKQFTFPCDECNAKIIENTEVGARIVEKLICHPLEMCPLRGKEQKPTMFKGETSSGLPKRKIRING